MLAFLASLVSCAHFLQHEEKSFLSWMRSNYQYFTGDDYHLRFGIFITNLRLIQEHNSKNKRFTVGMNKFAAYTPSEYKSLLGYRQNRSPKISSKSTKPTPNEFSFDWRDKGIACGLRDQGQCGSCWAFSAIEAAESGYALSTGVCVLFSVQNLIDCVTTCYGCNGGIMTDAYDYIIKSQSGQFCREDSYPYTGVEGTCKYSESEKVGRLLRKSAVYST